MQNYTLTIQENNSKALALLDYLKSIDFIKISKADDWWNTLTAEQQGNINKGAAQLDNGEGIAHNDIRKNVTKLLGKNE